MFPTFILTGLQRCNIDATNFESAMEVCRKHVEVKSYQVLALMNQNDPRKTSYEVQVEMGSAVPGSKLRYLQTCLRKLFKSSLVKIEVYELITTSMDSSQNTKENTQDSQDSLEESKSIRFERKECFLTKEECEQRNEVLKNILSPNKFRFCFKTNPGYTRSTQIFKKSSRGYYDEELKLNHNPHNLMFRRMDQTKNYGARKNLYLNLMFQKIQMENSMSPSE